MLNNYSDRMKVMVSLQEKLNVFTCGEKWKEGWCKNTKGERETVFPLAVKLELAELIDSLNWKHWKDVEGEPDYNNLFMEYVDVLHFMLSIMIILESEEHITDIDVIKSNTGMGYVYIPLKAGITATSDDVIKTSIELSDQLTYIMDSYDIGPDYSLDLGVLFLKLTENVLSFTGKTFEDVYKLYLVKNTLNIFRQNNGYKEGTYIKIWGGKEDNVVLEEISKDMEDYGVEFSFFELNERLETKYRGIINGKNKDK